MTDEELDAADARAEEIYGKSEELEAAKKWAGEAYNRRMAVFAEAVVESVEEFPYAARVAGPGSRADERLGLRVRRLVQGLPKVAP